VPYGFATIAMVLVGRSSDRRGERRWHLVGGALAGVVGLVVAGIFSTTLSVGLAAMTLATVGVLSAAPLFWTLPTGFLRGASAAAGIAAINSIGNLAGFLSPYLIGLARDLTGQATFGLYAIALFILVGAALVIPATRPR
jgi:nitrate/nitrite transporter NarK